MRGEYRPDRFCSAHGPLALLRVSEVCCSLSRRCSRQRLLLPGPVSGDGFRSVDLPRELARYRGMLAFDERQAVPHGLRGRVARTTLADANESHDWRIYADFAQVL